MKPCGDQMKGCPGKSIHLATDCCEYQGEHENREQYVEDELRNCRKAFGNAGETENGKKDCESCRYKNPGDHGVGF